MIDHNDLIGKKVYRAFDKKIFVCCTLSINPKNYEISIVLVDLDNFEKYMLNPMELSVLGGYAHLVLWDHFIENYKFSQYKDFSSSKLEFSHNVLAVNWQLIKRNFTDFLVPLIPEENKKNTGKDHP